MLSVVCVIIIIINDIYMAQVRRKEMQQMRQVSCYTLSVAYVVKNVFSRVRNTDNDMSNRSAGVVIELISSCMCVYVYTAVTVSRSAWKASRHLLRAPLHFLQHTLS